MYASAWYIQPTDGGAFVHSGFSSERINLSPFTKDFRGEEQLNESIEDLFQAARPYHSTICTKLLKVSNLSVCGEAFFNVF